MYLLSQTSELQIINTSIAINLRGIIAAGSIRPLSSCFAFHFDPRKWHENSMKRSRLATFISPLPCNFSLTHSTGAFCSIFRLATVSTCEFMAGPAWLMRLPMQTTVSMSHVDFYLHLSCFVCVYITLAKFGVPLVHAMSNRSQMT